MSSEGLFYLLDSFDPVHVDFNFTPGGKQYDRSLSSRPPPVHKLSNRRVKSLAMSSANPGMSFLLKAIPFASFAHQLQTVDMQFTYPHEVKLFSSLLDVVGPSILNLKLDVAWEYASQLLYRTHAAGVEWVCSSRHSPPTFLLTLCVYSLDQGVLDTFSLAPCPNLETLTISVAIQEFYWAGRIIPWDHDGIVRLLGTIRSSLRNVELDIFLGFHVESLASVAPCWMALDAALSSSSEQLQSVTLMVMNRALVGGALKETFRGFFPRTQKIAKVLVL